MREAAGELPLLYHDDALDPIRVPDCEIQGRVIGVVRATV